MPKAPVQPPAGRAPAGRTAAAVAFVLGLRAALAALVVGSGVSAVHGLRGGGWMALAPALLGLLAALRLVVAASRDQALGLRLTGDDQPELAAFVDGIAHRLRSEPPDEIWLTPEVDAFATVRRRLPLLGRRRRVLGLGLGTLAVVSLEQARAVIVHELAHLDAAGTRPLRWLRGTQSSLSIAAASFGGVGGTPFAWLSRALQRLAGPVFRQEELDADAAAVVACGSASVVGALRRIDSGAALYDRFAAHYVEPLWRRGMAPTQLVEGFRSLRAASPPPVSEDQPDQAEQGTHPPVPLRIAHAEQLGRAALAAGPPPGPASWPGERDPHEPAWSLLDRPEALDLRVSRAYTAASVGRAFEVTWERLTPAWFQEDTRAGTEALYAAATTLAPAGWPAAGQPPDADPRLGLVLALLEDGRHRELVAALAAELAAGSAGAAVAGEPPLSAQLRACRPEHVPHLTRDVLAAYLGRALSAALVDRAGCTWSSLWSGPSLLRVPSGELLELRGLVAAAASAPCWAGALRRRVADAGLAI